MGPVEVGGAVAPGADADVEVAEEEKGGKGVSGGMNGLMGGL